VGDYDLLDVIDAKAKGRQMVDASKDVKDFSNPLVKKFRDRFNKKAKWQGSLHGGQAGLVSEKFGGLIDEPAMLFRAGKPAALLPDGAAVREFFEDIGRPTVMGKHGQGGQPLKVDHR
jgi:hypothetical protein